MSVDVVERRHHRRVDLRVLVVVRALEEDGSVSEPYVGSARNVSLAGVYAVMPEPFPLTGGKPVSFSVSIPQESWKSFPFVRLLGKGWIVRVDPMLGPEPQSGPPVLGQPQLEEKQAGVAIAFSKETTALGTIGTG